MFAAGLAIGGRRPVRRRLLHVPAARLRHARAGRRRCSTCRWCSPWTAPASSATTAPRTTAPSTCRSCASSPTSTSWRRPARRSCSACWPRPSRWTAPSAIRYPRGLAAPFAPPDELEPLAVGEACVLQEGADVALIGVGTGVGIAREAAALLAAQGEAPTRRRRALREAARHGAPGPARRRAHAARHGRGERAAPAASAAPSSRTSPGPASRSCASACRTRFVPHGDRDALLRDVGPHAAGRGRSRRGAHEPAALTRVK